MTREEKEQIQKLRSDGYGSKFIAHQLNIPLSTVKTYLSRVPKESGDMCPQCGMKLEHLPHRKKKKFCSDKCRMLWWNAHQDQVNRQAYYRCNCAQCGKEFISYGNNKRKFCSRDCYAKYRSIPASRELAGILSDNDIC